jgi:hypothetical protein
MIKLGITPTMAWVYADQMDSLATSPICEAGALLPGTARIRHGRRTGFLQFHTPEPEQRRFSSSSIPTKIG